MLDIEDVDENYFLPSSSNSLANIFTNNSKSKAVIDKEEAEPLKIETAPPEISVKSQCILASTFSSYLWNNNNQTYQGKIGFAIVKTAQNSLLNHEIIIYDSNKKTLSNTLISNSLEVKLKENIYLSFYDNSKRFWTVHGESNEILKVVDMLRSLEVKVTDQSPKEESNVPTINKTEVIEATNIKETINYDSDTESSTENKKTKAAILNRMASMGQSILPKLPFKPENKSDSSDDDTDRKVKIPKNVIKRQFHTPDIATNQNSTQIALITSSSINQSNSTSKFVPNSTPVSSDVNNLLTEQRISQTELRILMTRLSDKLDSVVNKVNANVPNTPNHVYDKLITEYENKISAYENLLKTNEIAYKNCPGLDTTNLNNESKNSRTKDSEMETLKNTLEEKNRIIDQLSNELKKNNSVPKSNDTAKQILNEVFSIIDDEFKDDCTYSGVLLKERLSKVMKKVTLETLRK